MPILYFFAGFVSAVSLTALIMAVVYAHLKRSRKKRIQIKGYLDLIPDLTLQQRQKVQEIREVFLPKVHEIRQNLHRQRSQLADLLFDEPSDRVKIDQKSDQIKNFQSELESEVIEHIIEEKELLSPAQKRKFHEIIIEQFSSGGLGIHDVKGRKWVE